MKKFKNIGYIILIFIIVILGFVIYSNASKKDNNEQNEKIFSEIKYVESKLVSLFNEMNKIESRNYNIAVGEVSKEATEGSSGESSFSSGSGGSGGGSGTSSGEQSDESGSGTSNSSNNKEDYKKFELQSNGILTNKEDINWDQVKGEIENLYTSLATMTIDLYNSQSDQNSILAFNQQLDKLVTIVKNENKEETLLELSNLYDNLSTITQNIQGEDLYKVLVETKDNIFKAYSKLDSEKWEEISKDVNEAISSYSKLLTNTNIQKENQYSINKGYIILNELQNAVNIKDVSVFLIKYKNLLEELNTM